MPLGAFALWCFIVLLRGDASGSKQGASRPSQRGLRGTLRSWSQWPLSLCIVASVTLLVLSVALFVFGSQGQEKEPGVFFQRKSRPFVSADLWNGNLLITSQHEGRVYAVEAETGRIVWQRFFQDRPFSWSWSLCAPAAAAGDMVYVSACGGNLYGVSPDKGIVWKREGLGRIVAQPLVFGDNLYVVSLNKELTALERNTGRAKWRHQTGGYVSASPLVEGNQLLFGSGDGYFQALDVESGKVLWKVSLGAPIDAGAVSSGDELYVGTTAGDLYELRTEDGQVVRRIEIGSPIIARLALSPKGMLYAWAIDGRLYAVDLGEGKIKWQGATGGAILVSPVAIAGAVFGALWTGGSTLLMPRRDSFFGANKQPPG